MKNTRWRSLVILCTGFLLIVVDMTIVNVALPSIKRDLGFSLSGLAWVINAYLIAFGGRLLLAGLVGDLFGRKRVYLAGLGIFIGAFVHVASPPINRCWLPPVLFKASAAPSARR
jgi:MFS family permease